MKTSIKCVIVMTLAAVCTAFGQPTDLPAAGELIQIESVLRPGSLLRVQDARSADGTPMVLYPRQAWKCMTWQCDAAGDGLRLTNQFTHKTFGPTTTPATTEPSTTLPLAQHRLAKEASPAETFRFEPVQGEANVYRILHPATGLAVEALEDGDVVLKARSDAAAQRWRLLPKPERYTG